jgi:hypothetical protein
MASQSHRVYVAHVSFSRHLLQTGFSVSPSLKKCSFRRQCPVNSPTTHLNWSLFNVNRFFILLAEDPSTYKSLHLFEISELSPYGYIHLYIHKVFNEIEGNICRI